MRLCLAHALVLVALAAAWPSAARAQAPLDAQVDLARRHYQSGSAYFEESRYDDAAREFRESYRLAPRVDLLYNIAQCFLRKGDSARATDFLRFYLQGKPDAPDRAAVERTIAALSSHIGRVRIVGAPIGADVIVGGREFGKAPLPGPVAVTAGRVRIEVRLDDGSVRSLDVRVLPDEEVVAALPAPAVVVHEKVVERVIERPSARWYDSGGGWAALSLGVAAVVAGGVMAGPGASAIATGQKTATTEAEWRTATGNASAMQWGGVGLVAAGVVGVGVGALLFGLKARSAGATVGAYLLPGTPGGGGLPAGGGLSARGVF